MQTVFKPINCWRCGGINKHFNFCPLLKEGWKRKVKT